MRMIKKYLTKVQIHFVQSTGIMSSFFGVSELKSVCNTFIQLTFFSKLFKYSQVSYSLDVPLSKVKSKRYMDYKQTVSSFSCQSIRKKSSSSLVPGLIGVVLLGTE